MTDQFKIVAKYDYQIDDHELRQILKLYDSCFYQNRLSQAKPNDIQFVIRCLIQSHIFKWYLLKDLSQNPPKVLAMASFVYDYSNAFLFDLNLDLGENLCSVAVDPSCRRQGHARKLMQAIIQDFRKNRPRRQDPLVLEIKQANSYFQILYRFYGSLGFEATKNTAESTYMTWSGNGESEDESELSEMSDLSMSDFSDISSDNLDTDVGEEAEDSSE